MNAQTLKGNVRCFSDLAFVDWASKSFKEILSWGIFVFGGIFIEFRTIEGIVCIFWPLVESFFKEHLEMPAGRILSGDTIARLRNF